MVNQEKKKCQAELICSAVFRKKQNHVMSVLVVSIEELSCARDSQLFHVEVEFHAQLLYDIHRMTQAGRGIR